jgi:hypothetical protein
MFTMPLVCASCGRTFTTRQQASALDYSEPLILPTITSDNLEKRDPNVICIECFTKQGVLDGTA